jgi:diguanylate cyclase (GGDEF)-like protein
MLDIDYFKSINDRHGHDVGDAALCAVGSACQERTGEAAATTRWGGEWFVVVLPSTHNAAALASAEEL